MHEFDVAASYLECLIARDLMTIVDRNMVLVIVFMTCVINAILQSTVPILSGENG